MSVFDSNVSACCIHKFIPFLTHLRSRRARLQIIREFLFRFRIVTVSTAVCNKPRIRLAHAVNRQAEAIAKPMSHELLMHPFHQTPMLANALQFAVQKATPEGKITMSVLLVLS